MNNVKFHPTPPKASPAPRLKLFGCRPVLVRNKESGELSVLVWSGVGDRVLFFGQDAEICHGSVKYAEENYEPVSHGGFDVAFRVDAVE